LFDDLDYPFDSVVEEQVINEPVNTEVLEVNFYDYFLEFIFANLFAICIIFGVIFFFIIKYFRLNNKKKYLIM